jgi:hypothetical protein
VGGLLRRIRFRAIQLVVVAVLAAAGVVAAAALAGGTASNHTTTKNGTGGGSHNTNQDTTAPAPEETTDAPPPPPPTTTPPDPLAPPGTAPSTPARPADKKQAGITAAELRIVLVGTASFLGDCLTPSEGIGPGASATDPVLCFVAAQAIITEALAEYKLYLDPPDPNFMQVTLGVASRVPPGGFRCSTTVKRSDCAAVTAAVRRFLVALTANAEASRGSGVTLERYSGAVQAHSVPGAFLQSAAQKAYAGLTVSTKAAQQAAGVALGLALRKAHLERLLTRTQFQARVTKLRTSNGFPRQFIQRLIAAKTITSTADLDAWLSTFKRPVPYMSPSQALSRPLPTAASAALWRTMTVKDLAVLIRGLVAQGALPAAFGNTLLGELRTIANAPSAEARKPLIAKLAADCGAITGPAGVLLAAGTNGLG